MLEELHEIDDQMVDNVAGEMSHEGLSTLREIEVHHRPSPRREVALAAAPVNGPVNGAAEFEQRLEAVERLVQVHDKTIKRAIDLASDYLNNGATSEGRERVKDARPQERKS